MFWIATALDSERPFLARRGPRLSEKATDRVSTGDLGLRGAVGSKFNRIGWQTEKFKL